MTFMTNFNWRAALGNAERLSPEVTSYLDIIASLCEDDGFYPVRTANRHSCALDNPLPMLHHAMRTGLCTSLADHMLFDKACSEVLAHQSTFFCDAEIERRMQEANGDCPMCGFAVSFNGPDHEGRCHQITHCQHNLGHVVREDDIEAYLRRPSSWHGKHWPYSFMEGRKIEDSPSLPEWKKTPCAGCAEMAADLRMEHALLKLFSIPNLGAYAKEGWSSPVSEFTCKPVSNAPCQDSCCSHVYMRVKQLMGRARDGWSHSHEARLNGAGLKLYITTAHTYGLRDLRYGMRVGGDQLGDYALFGEMVSELFAELDVSPRTGDKMAA